MFDQESSAISSVTRPCDAIHTWHRPKVSVTLFDGIALRCSLADAYGLCDRRRGGGDSSSGGGLARQFAVDAHLSRLPSPPTLPFAGLSPTSPLPTSKGRNGGMSGGGAVAAAAAAPSGALAALAAETLTHKSVVEKQR